MNRSTLRLWVALALVSALAYPAAAQLPADYRDNAFVVLFLPGELHRVVLHRDAAGAFRGAEVQEFAAGLRLPADVTVSPNGSLIVTEFGRGTVLAISAAG